MRWGSHASTVHEKSWQPNLQAAVATEQAQSANGFSASAFNGLERTAESWAPVMGTGHDGHLLMGCLKMRHILK